MNIDCNMREVQSASALPKDSSLGSFRCEQSANHHTTHKMDMIVRINGDKHERLIKIFFTGLILSLYILQASLDEPTSCLVMHRTEPSSLQSLSLQLADKLYNLVENNERILDQKPFFTRGMQVRSWAADVLHGVTFAGFFQNHPASFPSYCVRFTWFSLI